MHLGLFGNRLVRRTLTATAAVPNAPTITGGLGHSYQEGKSAGYAVGTVTATDAVAVTQWRFTVSGTGTTADGFFAISAAGAITLTASGAASAANDFETLPNVFAYAVQAGNALNNWSNSATVTITVLDIDDTAPVVSGGQSFSYAENQTTGYTIGTVTATDAVGVTNFRFTTTTTSTSSDGYYSISSGGVVTLTASGAAGEANDYETGSNSFVHGIQARDAAGNWSASVNVTFNVTDVVDTSVMSLGMNLGSPTYYGALPFANLMMVADQFTQVVGSSSYTNTQGEIVATNNNDVFRVVLREMTLLAAGTYTIKVPAGATVGLGTFSTGPTFGIDGSHPDGFYTSDFTLSLSPAGSGHLCLYIKGSTGTGQIAVIVPDHVTSYNAGNIWHSDFLSFYTTMGTRVLRTMDWTAGSFTAETDWTDRVLPGKSTLNCPAASGSTGATVPFEYIIDLANRLDKDVWVSIPPRATTSYITSLANLFNNGTGAVGSIGNTGLETGRKVYWELGNEAWNYGGYPYHGNTRWIEHYNHTKIAATVSGSVISKTAHGLSNGNILHGWNTPANRRAGVVDGSGGTNFWEANFGADNLYVTVLTANTFEVYTDVGRSTNKVTFPAAATSWVYVLVSEATQILDINYGRLSKRNWDIITPIMTTSRQKRVLAGQAAFDRFTDRTSGTGVLADTDCFAIAPYWYGDFMMGAVDKTSGTFAPKFYNPYAGTLITNLYPVGTDITTISEQDFIDGVGTVGTNGHQSLAYTEPASGTYRSVTSNITGLSNGTSYVLAFMFYPSETEIDQYRFKFGDTVTASATPSTHYIYNTLANQASANLLNIEYAIGSRSSGAQVRVDTHVATIAASAKPTIELIGYEGGNHMAMEGETTELAAWITGTYLPSAEHAEVMDQYLHTMANKGMKLFCWYTDINGNAFSIAESYQDTSDPRVVKLNSYSGTIAVGTMVSVSDVVASDVTTDPGTFPHTVHTFADGALTYTLLGGDLTNMFSISGANLRMLHDTGVNWATATTQTLYVRATNGDTSDTFTVTFNLGVNPATWYASDAVFALDMTEQAVNTSLTPDVGSVLTLTGTGGTLSGGLIDNNANSSYANSNGSTTIKAVTQPFLIAYVGNRDSTVYTGQWCLQVGSSAQFIRVSPNDATTMIWEWYNGSMVSVNSAWGSGTGVHWLYHDGSGGITVGRDQTTNDTGTRTSNAGNMPRDISIGSTSAKVGSVQVVFRSGLTLAGAKNIVQSMQTLHGL